ncbi:MAG: nitrate reductase subunit beta, partial [Propionibacterium sp.]|nr:nitrate reductase subunit beta [Propionibacterium sp.]
AGDTEIVTGVLQKLAAMRSYMRDVTLGRPRQPELAHAVGMEPGAMEQMYRLLAIAKYNERYVIPKAHREKAHNLEELACSLDFEGGPGMEEGPFGSTSGRVVPVAIESYADAKARQTDASGA